MKKVIFEETKTETIGISQIKNESHVGFIHKGDKAYIACIMEGKFMPLRTIGGHGLCNFRLGEVTFSSLIDAVVLVKEKWDIEDFYVFNTRKELYKWLSE